MGNHQGNKNSSLPNNWEFESARQRGRGLSCFNLQNKLHISPRALKTSSRGRRLKRLLMMNVEKRVQSTTEQRFDTATGRLSECTSETIKEENKYCSPTLDFTSGFKATCTSLALSSKSHSTGSRTSNPNFCGHDGDGGNSEMDGDLSSELSEYDNELYSGNWTVEDSSENSQGEISPQSNLMIGSTASGLPVKHAKAKESSRDLQSATSSVRTKVGKLEGVIQQNSNINSDQLRDYFVPPKHTSTSSELKDRDSKLPMSQTQSTELRQEEVLSMEKLHVLGGDLNQSLQKALKAFQPFADHDEDWKAISVPKTEKMSLGTVWMQDPDEFMLVCQNSPLNRVQIKSERKTALFSSFSLSPSSSNSLGSISPLGSPCSLSLSDPVLQQCIFPLPKEENEEGTRMQLIQKQCSVVDNSNIIGYVSAPDEPSISWTAPNLSTMLISLRTGEDTSLLALDECVSQYKPVVHSSKCNHSSFLRITPAEHDIISDPLTSSEPELTPESEERTPGRLQAIWPPPKSKDKEEKIGLKYTEAEHQAALLQLKRECKEEVETLEADFKLQLFRLREENAESVSRLQSAITELKEKAKHSRRDLQDVAVSTEDGVTPRAFRTVCIQTDRETFIKPMEDAELSSGPCPQPNVPKKLNLTTINLGFSGKHPEAKQEQPPPPPPPPPPLPVQPDFDSNRVPPPPPVPNVSCDGDVFSKPVQSLERLSPPEKGNGPPPPPPPPPTAGSGPPPPPPVPGSSPSPPSGAGLFFSRAEEWPQRKPRVEPVCPMKTLYWTRVQIQNNRNDTLWSSLKEPAIINTNEFAELFSKMSAPAKRKPLSEAYEKKAKSKKIIKLLDGKRSQAVGILISSLHLDMKDIQQAVLMLDNSVVDLDAIEALYENRAQPEELERIRKHYETSDEEQVKLLDKPEQFLYELSRIPEFSLRARCIILQSTFADAIASIKHKTEIVLHVCEELLERTSVRGVLGLVLALGNYMNGGSRTRGQADGFGLDILPKLKDVKSRDNRLSLLDYMVSYYARNIDENAGTENCVFPLPEPQDVFFAAQVKFEDLTKELRKLGKDLADCEKDVQSVCSKTLSIYIHPFKEKMEAFIATAQNERTATEHHLISAQKSFRDLVEYFGLKPRSGEQDVLPGHVFTLWFEFCNDFKTRWKRENKTISKERLNEAQQSVRDITAEKKVETRRVHAHGLKERLRLKEASLSST